MDRRIADFFFQFFQFFTLFGWDGSFQFGKVFGETGAGEVFLISRCLPALCRFHEEVSGEVVFITVVRHTLGTGVMQPQFVKRLGVVL